MSDSWFEDAWREHSRAAIRYCVFATGSRDDGEEIAAETSSRLLGSGRRLRPRKVESWLFTVARNLCVSYHRRAGRERRALARMTCRTSGHEEHWRHDVELWECVRALDERSRLAIYLRLVEDRPFSAVASTMGLTEGAAKMTYYRAMGRLRNSLDPETPRITERPAGGANHADQI